MAALPYMQLYVADYLADTMHLTTEEHGAYLLLIFNYWQTGKPLKAKSERLATIARMSNDRWTDVEDTLQQFFVLRDDLWVHPRVEADLNHVAELQEKAVKAGKASALARKKKSDIKINARSTDVETDVEHSHQHGGNHIDPDPNTDIDKEKITKKEPLDFSPWPDKPSPQVLKDFKKTRGKALTQTAINRMAKQINLGCQSGLSVDDCLAFCCEAGWQAFNYQWYLNREKQNGNGRKNSSGLTGAAKRASDFHDDLKLYAEGGAAAVMGRKDIR